MNDDYFHPDASKGRTLRQAHVDFARKSVEQKGFAVSPEGEKLSNRYIAGLLTLQELIAGIEKHTGARRRG